MRKLDVNRMKSLKLGKPNTAAMAKVTLIILMDILATLVSFFFGLWMRFDFVFADISHIFLENYGRYIGLWCAITVGVFVLFRLYNSIWVFVSTPEVFRILGAYLVLGIVGVLGFRYFGTLLPRGSALIGFVLSFCCTVGIRFSYRLVRTAQIKFTHMIHASGLKNIMIIGAGDAGRAIANEFVNSEYVRDHVACVIDDNPAKLHKQLCGIPIVGGRHTIPEMVKQYNIDKIIFAIPSCSAKNRKEILDICTTTGCEVQMLPGIYQMVNGEVSVSKLRRVDPQDLLGREPIQVNVDEIMGYVSGKVVLVTGGGGSIGSELCRQIARANPRQLIIFDIYENNAYEIQMELKRNHPELNLEVLIGSVRNTNRVNWLMEHYRPDLVFHAAAHKHVPLMEHNCVEAIENNVFGTKVVLELCEEFSAERFMMVSTDKAVNPTNVMGATKRMCEMLVQSFSTRGTVRCSATRFGNVLGSAGSVIPLFKRQIANGGPVTITDKRIIRYFMTIPEASQLVLQSGAMAKNGELFVLDMGQPVRILDLAENMIRLSGVQGIEIVETGLRPGEKLFEELLVKTEELDKTENSMIFIERDIPISAEEIENKLNILQDACLTGDDDIAREALRSVVPTFKHPEDVNGDVSGTEKAVCSYIVEEQSIVDKETVLA